MGVFKPLGPCHCIRFQGSLSLAQGSGDRSELRVMSSDSLQRWTTGSHVYTRSGNDGGDGILAIAGNTPTKTVTDAGPLVYMQAFGRRSLNPFATRGMAEADWIRPDAKKEIRLVSKLGNQMFFDSGGVIRFLPTHEQRKLATMQSLALHPLGPGGYKSGGRRARGIG